MNHKWGWQEAVRLGWVGPGQGGEPGWSSSQYQDHLERSPGHILQSQITGSPHVLSSFPGPSRAGGPSLLTSQSVDRPLLSSGHQHRWGVSSTSGFGGCRSQAPGSEPSGWGAPSPLSQLLLFLLFLSNLSWGKWPQ